jgi:hypothetical protein
MAREALARIREVEGTRSSEEGSRAFEAFDRRGLSPEERRRAMLARFRRDAAE